MTTQLQENIFKISSEQEFNDLALQSFEHQIQNNPLYFRYCNLILNGKISVNTVEEIPYLPIQFFKTHKVLSSNKVITHSFSSSGTTGTSTSSHHVTNIELYRRSYLLNFQNKYPNFQKSSIIALLPSYIERGNSSLLYMMDDLISKSNGSQSGFYKTLTPELITFLENDPSPKILIGVSFALLDACTTTLQLKNTTVIETGGMKGKRKEIIRDELHALLRAGLSVDSIHSEYGMTELLSQAYLSKSRFEPPNWMKVSSREITDPLTTNKTGKGALNIIDLANFNSCPFIATEDLGIVYPDGSFDVKGRMDHSLTRGCNLLL